MARPKKDRFLICKIKCREFVPVGLCVDYVRLRIDEFEAIKLKDFDGMDQKIAAKRLRISQPTFHRILLSARRKIGDALVNGKEIVIK